MTRARIEDAFAFMAAGEVPQAVAVLQALAAATPAHATVHVLLAQGYERLHRWNEALEAWQAAALLLPDAVVVRQGSLRATRVLAALRTMADERAYAAPAARVEPPPPAPDPLASLTPAAALPPPDAFGRPAEAPSPFAPSPPEPSDSFAAPSPEPSVPESAVHVAPPVDARPYTPAPEPASAPSPSSPPAAPSLDTGLDAFLAAADRSDAPRSAWEAPDPAQKRPLDLDRLIGEIENAGPIRPRADLDAIAPPLLDDDDEDPVSETLARIYAGQGQYAQALRIYERLAALHPADAPRFHAEADALRPKVVA